jgi:hypothetical protein
VASGMAALAANARYQDAVAPLTDRAGAAAPDAPIGAR